MIDIAKLNAGATVGFFLAQTFAAQVVGLEVEVGLDLLGKIFSSAFGLNIAYASSPCGSVPGSRIKSIARVSRFHCEVFSSSSARPFAVSE